MSEPERPLALAADFPPATREQWRKLVDGVLKGAPFEQLISTTYDALAIAPLSGRRADARPIATRAGAAAWQMLGRIDDPDPVRANETALHELENGATGLSLIFAGSIGDHGFGLPPTEAALARALEGINLVPGSPIECDLSPAAEATIDAALAKGLAVGPAPFSATGSTGSIGEAIRAGGRETEPSRLRLGHDPIGAMALSGSTLRHWSKEAPHFARRLLALARDGWNGGLAVADGRVIHNAGGSEAQELAFVLSVAVAYLRALEVEGCALEVARRMLFFRLCADADQFLTIAKFRSLRKLWARVEAACGLAAEPIFVSAETAWRMMTQRDVHVNILRTAVAVLAAALGGADAIAVLPFTAARGLPDRFARRVARNLQLIVLEESHLAEVADPAAGSGTTEELTAQLCGAAWALFQEIEAAGGAAAALASGFIQNKVSAVRERRAAGIARCHDALTGVSIFPNLDEPEVAVILPRPTVEGDHTQHDRAALERSSSPAPLRAAEEDHFASLVPIRLAEPFERLRNASDRVLTTTGTRPKIFLANLGASADFIGRMSFAQNFFAAGGIEAVSNNAPAAASEKKGEENACVNTNLAALVSAFHASGAALVCLCSSDKLYERDAPAAAQALKAARARHIYLAGAPAEREVAWRAAGVQSFIYEGCEALAMLNAAYDILGIEIG